MTIRMAVPQDGPACAAIQRPYIEETAINFLYRPLTEAEFSDKIASLLPRYPFLVAEEEGQVVGFAYASELRPHDAYDWDVETSIYIDRAWTGRGIGRALYDALLKVLDAQGFLNSYACITDNNPRSVTMHERMGFRHVGAFPFTGFKQGKWYGVLWLCRMPETYPDAPVPPCPVTAVDLTGILTKGEN